MTKLTKWHVLPAKTQISLGIYPVCSVFAVRMKKAWVLSYPLSAQRRLWSDAQADLSSMGAQSFCWFCHKVAQIVKQCFSSSLTCFCGSEASCLTELLSILSGRGTVVSGFGTSYRKDISLQYNLLSLQYIRQVCPKNRASSKTSSIPDHCFNVIDTIGIKLTKLKGTTPRNYA